MEGQCKGPCRTGEPVGHVFAEQQVRRVRNEVSGFHIKLLTASTQVGFGARSNKRSLIFINGIGALANLLLLNVTVVLNNYFEVRFGEFWSLHHPQSRM